MATKLYNLSYLHELSSGDQDFEKSMIDYFISNSPKVLEAVDQLISKEDWAEIREVIHKFIPNLNMVGANELLDDANKVELYTEKKINLDQVSGHWIRVKTGCQTLIRQLETDFQ